jgi:hypothetical protein
MLEMLEVIFSFDFCPGLQQVVKVVEEGASDNALKEALKFLSLASIL